jgi:hypothetical protein
MKKYSMVLAISVLVVSSLGCRMLAGLMGGAPDVPNIDDISTVPPISSDDGNITVGGDPQFPTPSDAFNVVSAQDSLVFQTKLSSDEVIKFYQDEFGKLGYTEDTSMSVNFNGAFTLAFDGHESGRKIVMGGAPVGDGSTSVSIVLQ